MVLEVFIAMVSGGLITGVFSVILACLNRKWSKQDKKDDRIDAIVTAQKVTMIDRVRHLGKIYISDGEIHLEDKENLKEMYQAYKGLGGNGHLDQIMSEIEKLKVV